MGTIEVLKPGLLSSVQDAGRDGYRDAGVPRGGAFDSVALSVGNRLLGNSESDAAIEMTMAGGEFRFSAETVVCISGAHADDAMIISGDHQHPLLHQHPTFVPVGSTLRVGRLTNGVRGYLCVSGGIQSLPVLGSRSVLVSLPDAGLGRALIQGDAISFGAQESNGRNPSDKPGVYEPEQAQNGVRTLRIVPGTHFESFSEPQREALVDRAFRVSDQSNRVGIRLSESFIKGFLPYGIASEGTLPGYIQVPQSGSPIVLGVDGPTTGGYPVIACVIEADLPVLAQCAMREQVQFRWVSLSDAVRAKNNQIAMIQTIRPLDPLHLPWESPNA